MAPSQSQVAKVATLCSGIESFIIAVENLCAKNQRLVLDHVASCEKDPKVIKVIKRNFKPRRFYKDTADCVNDSFPFHTLLGAGPPCQPYAGQGQHLGMADCRSQPLIDVLCVISLKKPYAFIIEEVENFTRGKHTAEFAEVIVELERIGVEHGNKRFVFKNQIRVKLGGIMNQPGLWQVGGVSEGSGNVKGLADLRSNHCL